MVFNELRKDYVLNRWVVIAARRKRRPTDFVKARKISKPTVCPFCPGNEDMTPPASLVYLKTDNKIVEKKDEGGFRHKNWVVRCVPNLYPAFMPPTDESTPNTYEIGLHQFIDAVGHHEVLIESPDHDEHPGVARTSQLVYVLSAYRDRFKALSSEKYVKYVSIFRNHGVDAGASLSHAHTQIITTPSVPRIVTEELDGSKDFWKENGRCLFCEIILNEVEGPRLVWENISFVVFAPWASVHPFEFWIFPKRHQSTILDMTESQVEELAITLRVCFGGLNELLENPSYNFGFHMTPAEEYHWHIEVYPRLSIWAGFEKSTGIFINVVSPEDAASSLRKAALDQGNHSR